MSDTHDAQAELRRRFEATISGSELTELRELSSQLAVFGYQAEEPVERPELRRPPLSTTTIFRVRIDLDHSEPPIWRRLDVRSDITLDAVHQVLQAAFGWTDSHLHRFSLGGGPFDHSSQLFLCPYDVQEPEFEDEGGLAAADVRLDETVQAPGDVLQYVYDYGDSWQVTLRLEEIRPAGSDAPMAVAVDGRRAAPPDDSGGAVDAESLAEILNDPAHFDLAEINAALRDPYSS